MHQSPAVASSWGTHPPELRDMCRPRAMLLLLRQRLGQTHTPPGTSSSILYSIGSMQQLSTSLRGTMLVTCPPSDRAMLGLWRRWDSKTLPRVVWCLSAGGREVALW